MPTTILRDAARRSGRDLAGPPRAVGRIRSATSGGIAAAGGEGSRAGFLPLHKLSQWLSYSLLHPLAVAGLRVMRHRRADRPCRVSQRRVVRRRRRAACPSTQTCWARRTRSASEVVVEWRALTVALLDRLAPLVRERARRWTQERLPLAAVLEGGTWAAGRELARGLRADGGPPIRVLSDGTVF